MMLLVHLLMRLRMGRVSDLWLLRLRLRLCVVLHHRLLLLLLLRVQRRLRCMHLRLLRLR
jgi:hypothetical protein